MAYREVKDIKSIQQFDKKLRATLTKKGPLYEKRSIGYPGGYVTKPVNFLNKGPGAIWSCSWIKKNGEIVNLFGRGDYGAKQTLLIDLQFNYSTDKVRKSLGGAFLEDTDTGEISLAHRGIITVINRIPKESVFEAMASHAVEAESGRKFVEFLLITDLESKTLLRDVGEFAIELRDSVRAKTENSDIDSKAKNNQKKGKKSGFDQLKDYFEEFTGQRKSYKPKRVYTKSNHGKVVEALKKELSSRGQVYKSRAVDLVVEEENRALLFEVKTNSDTQSIYTAIGQLSIHAPPTREFIGKPVTPVIVMPDYPIARILEVIANELKYRMVTYCIDKQGGVSFQDLDKI